MSDLPWKHIPPWNETGMQVCYNANLIFISCFTGHKPFVDDFMSVFLCKCLFCCLKGPDLIEKANGLHGFMNWKRNLLTVSLTSYFICHTWMTNKSTTCGWKPLS